MTRCRLRNGQGPALLVCLLLGSCGSDSPPESTTTYLRTVLDLVESADAFEVVAERADRPVMVGKLSPGNRKHGLVDRASLVLPPPAAVTFAVPEARGELFLDVSAAADRDVGREAPLTVVFEIAVDGELRWREELALEPGNNNQARAWREPPEDGLIPLPPGARVELRTRLASDPTGTAPAPIVGFGHPRVLEAETRSAGSADAARPNVILIVMDTLRRDALSCYGGRPGTTPNLDALAVRGTRFERAYAASNWTWPSTASVLTGLLPTEHGVENSDSCWLAGGLLTLGEAMQVAGYATAAFTGNPLIHSSGNYDQGFDHFVDTPGGFLGSEALVPPALEWLRTHRDERFFLYLHLIDPHFPYEPSPESRARLLGETPTFGTPLLGPKQMQKLLARSAARSDDGDPYPDEALDRAQIEWLQELYLASCADADAWVGRVLDELSALGLAEDTVVVFTADHGEQFVEHGYYGHGYTLYDEETAVPLIAAGPGVAAGEVVATPVANRHVAHTLATRVGARSPSSFDALDLFASEIPARKILLSTQHGQRRGKRRTIHGLVDGDVLIQVAVGSGREGADEVFLHDLASDSGARRDVAGVQTAEAAQLEALLRARLERAGENRVSMQMPAGQGTLDLLRDIGYGTDGEDD